MPCLTTVAWRNQKFILGLSSSPVPGAGRIARRPQRCYHPGATAGVDQARSKLL